MPRIRDLLRKKGTNVFYVHPDKTLYEAIKILADNFVGALLVIDDSGKICGIMTERDVLREVNQSHEKIAEKQVSDVMSRDVYIGSPEDDLDFAMYMMTTHRFRHLPIVEDGKLAGIISIGDVVKLFKSEHEYENRLLKDYIYGPNKTAP